MEKIKSRSLSEILLMKTEVHTSNDMIKKIYQDQRKPVEYLQMEVESTIMVILSSSILEDFLKQTNKASTPVLVLLD